MISFNPNSQGTPIIILRALAEHGDIESDHATEVLRSILEVPRTANVSTHLKRLNDYGLIEIRTDGSGTPLKRIAINDRGRQFIEWVNAYPESLKG